jgi:hypothetical protein
MNNVTPTAITMQHHDNGKNVTQEKHRTILKCAIQYREESE